MNIISKVMTGAAAAALITISAAPAEARHYGDYDRGHGIDTSDIITGVAILGGIAAIASALDRDGDRYGYNSRYRYRDGYTAAVNSCGYEAERYARGGRVNVTEVDRRSSGYRVRGWIDSGYAYGSEYGRYDRRYDDRYDRRYDRRYDDRYSSYGRDARVAFTCSARTNGRVTDFRVNNGYRW